MSTTTTTPNAPPVSPAPPPAIATRRPTASAAGQSSSFAATGSVSPAASTARAWHWSFKSLTGASAIATVAQLIGRCAGSDLRKDQTIVRLLRRRRVRGRRHFLWLRSRRDLLRLRRGRGRQCGILFAWRRSLGLRRGLRLGRRGLLQRSRIDAHLRGLRLRARTRSRCVV